MNEELKKTLKNVGYGAAGSIVGGVIGANLSNLDVIRETLRTELTDIIVKIMGKDYIDVFKDPKRIKSLCSLVFQYPLALLAFQLSYAYERRSVYREEQTKNFKLKPYALDTMKINGAIGIINLLYAAARLKVNCYFQKQGYSEEAASLFSDVILLPLYYGSKVVITHKLSPKQDNVSYKK